MSDYEERSQAEKDHMQFKIERAKLRDEFAGKALVGMLSSSAPMVEILFNKSVGSLFNKSDWANNAYAWADAMMEARENGSEGKMNYGAELRIRKDRTVEESYPPYSAPSFLTMDKELKGKEVKR